MITIDLESTEPLFSQLITQIKKSVDKGVLCPGDGLPSIRQLSSELGINAKTVAKAYNLLERDNVIQSKGYRGTFVHPEACSNTNTNINAWLEETLEKDIQRYRKSGATDSEIRIAFNKIISINK